MLLNDQQIHALCLDDQPMIDPFVDHSVKVRDGNRVISYGLSSFGYDIRLSDKELKVFTNIWCGEVDPRQIDSGVYTTPAIRTASDGERYVLLPPNTGMLGHTVEYFRMPESILGICQSKSTYARAFVSVLVTPLEPGWHGQLVVEVVNHTTVPARVYLNQGIAQLMFLKGDRPHVTYADRDGKYQGQRGTTDAKV